MKTTPTLVQIRPCAHQRYRQLPIFGRLLDDFVPWSFGRGYTIHAVYLQLDAVRHLDVWLRKQHRRSVDELTADDLAEAQRHFSRARDPRYAGGLRGFVSFLQSIGRIKAGHPRPLTRLELETKVFSEHLLKDRGAAASTCESSQRRIRHFLDFLAFDHDPSALARLSLSDIHRYFRSLTGLQRKTMQHVVGCVRGFLRFEFMRGVIKTPLHLQIDTVRTYRDEYLPIPVQWSELQQLLGRIDRSTPLGLRDHAVLTLAATYGLRASDVAHLTLDAIDWRKGTIQIVQCKTRQPLSLPLTDEAGAALAGYIKHARPASLSRSIFLRWRAPVQPLSLPGMSNTLRRASRTAGVSLKAAGFRCMRHALAMRLLRQDTPLKSIGDILGHRSTASTSVYLRLNVEDLRSVALPVPQTGANDRHPAISIVEEQPKQRCHGQVAPCGWGWSSFLADLISDYLATQRALGREYETQEQTLRGLDFFLSQHYSRFKAFTPEMFVEWSRGLSSLCPTTARMRMLCVRKFCCHAKRLDANVFIPDPRTFPKELPHKAPYLLSEVELARVLTATERLYATRRNPLHRRTIRLAVLLMYCCGLRRGEVLNLHIADIDAEQMILHINETKFHKSRLIPLSHSVGEEVRQYLQERRAKDMPMEPSAPLVWNGHVRNRRKALALTSYPFWATWRKLCYYAGVVDQRGRPPRLHDLRHSFAVEVLRRGYQAGQNAQATLPRLSTYLGHADSLFTHYYLKFTEPLRCAASDRFRQYLPPATFLPNESEEGGVA